MADIKTEIKHWLEKALAKENLKNISVDILGNSEKGDGYLGDIVFVTATGINITTNKEKTLNLVLKCSKKSQALRDSIPIKEIFLKEILMYDEILPEFQQFQRSKSVENIFDCLAKYYGYFTNETTEIIVLENLKKIGYELWDQRKPLTTKHLLMILERYGQYHAISAAMQNQKPEKFNEFREKIENLTRRSDESGFVKLMSGVISDVYDLLKDSCSEEVLEKVKEFEDQVVFVMTKLLFAYEDDFKVISHGDCWNNNFMWKHYEHDKTSPEKVAFLDWQLSQLVSPVSDLAYFLFTAISEEDLNNFDKILDVYYNSFSKSLKQLGNNAEDIYPKEKLIADFKKYARYGLGLSFLIHKLGFTKKEDLPDIKKSADEGKKFGESFDFNVNDNDGYKQRVKPLVEFAVKYKLFD